MNQKSATQPYWEISSEITTQSDKTLVIKTANLKHECYSQYVYVNGGYVQITWLWRYFTLEITLGYKYEFISILAISNSQA